MSSGEIEKIEEVRPSVFLYAKGMENRLREKDEERGKDGWHDGKCPYYIERAMVCLFTIAQKLKTGKDTKEYIGIKEADQLKEDDIHFLIKKCIDGGNFLMMLADNLRDELIKRGVKKSGR